jgi:mannose-6-phosphate isomerase-like protein (cupin superfamily)
MPRSLRQAGRRRDGFDLHRILGEHAGAAARCPAMTTTRIAPHLTVDGDPYWYGNSLFEFLVPAASTGGALTVFRATMPEGFGPPRHIHTREDEVFLVEDGEALFDVDGRILTAGPGTTVFMPRGVPHTFQVQSPVSRMLGVMTPGGFEELFRTLGVAADERRLPPAGAVPFDLPAVMAEQERLGTRVVGPPLTGREA